MQVVFLGPPGAGKGTQAAFASKEFQLVHISTGDLIRLQLKSQSDLGAELRSYVEKGALVPDELIVEMVKDRLKQDDIKTGFLLDGFPRTVPQADALGAFVALDAVINIDVPSEHLAERIAKRRVCRECGTTYTIDELQGAESCSKCSGEVYQREDDQYETVMNRLRVFAEQTQPLVDYYREKGLLIEVDGHQSVDDVRKAIFEALERFR